MLRPVVLAAFVVVLAGCPNVSAPDDVPMDVAPPEMDTTGAPDVPPVADTPLRDVLDASAAPDARDVSHEDAAPDALDALDAPDAFRAGVLCGVVTCAVGMVCCFSIPGGRAVCTAPDACGDSPRFCDGPEDCPTDGECCTVSSPSGPGSRCVAPGACPHPVCHDDGDCDSGERCCAAPGYIYCDARCPFDP